MKSARHDPVPLTDPASESILSILVTELCWNTVSANRKLAALDDIFPAQHAGEFIIVRSDVHDLALQIVSHADSVRKILFNDGEKKIGENRHEYRTRLSRTRLLRTLIDAIDLPQIQNAKIRNRLAHLDEYIDVLLSRVSAAHPRSERLPFDHICYNISFSSYDVFQRMTKGELNSPYHIRSYVRNEGRYYHFGQVFDFKLLATEFAALETKLRTKVSNRSFEEGGRVIVL